MTCDVESMSGHFDHHAADYAEGMRSRFADMRQHCPVTHSECYDGFWVLSRYRDVARVLQDHRRFSSASGDTIPTLHFEYPPIPTVSDPPDHAHYRRVLWPFLTPSAVARYEPLVRETVTELIDEFIESGKTNIVQQLAKPVPARVTGQVFGFTAEEGIRLYDLFDAIIAGSAVDAERARIAAVELNETVQASIEEARVNPGDNVSTAIVNYDYEGRTFTNDEATGLLATAIGGALSTTVAGIGHAFNLLGQYPDQRRLVVEHPELAAGAVEEVLRVESPVNAVARTLTQQCEVEGVTFEPGDRVLLLVDSANYDGTAFEDPEQFRVDRANNAHLTFGHGIHKCEGQHLVRLELRVVIDEFLRRIPEYEIVGTPVISSQGDVYGPTDLHIVFPPGERVAHHVSTSKE